MPDAVCWSILEETQSRLNEMSFSPQGSDTVQPINSKRIVIWKWDVGSYQDEASLPQVETPGLVITPPLIIKRPPMAGTTERDDAFYPILVQLIDSDNEPRQKNLRTYLKWMEQIAHAFHAKGMETIPASIGDVYACYAEVTNTVDRKLWKRHGKFVAGVQLIFRAREPRGLAA